MRAFNSIDAKLLAFDKLVNNLKENRETGCFEFTRGKDYYGYGKLSVNGCAWSAHRLMFTLIHGDIPKFGSRSDGRYCILHKCDNPSCCNPDHLYLGSAADNARDASERNRIRVGYWRSGDPKRPFVRYGKVYWLIKGEVRSLYEWADFFSVHPQTLDARLKAGWAYSNLGMHANSGIKNLGGKDTYKRISGKVNAESLSAYSAENEKAGSPTTA